METLGNKFGGDSAAKFYCESCDYSTCRKCHFDDHLISSRHCKRKQMETNGNTIVGKTSVHCNICETCCKEFSSRSGLWKHKQKCSLNIKNDSIINTNNNMLTGLTEQLVIELVKQNKELLEIVKNGTTNHSHNTTHTNSHNKAFNLQFFLNETCKEAMNIGEFVDSLKMELSDLEHIGEAGYIEGITNIIVKNLKDLDVTKRPVHCTDKKRETVYIKDNNIWEKDENKSHMHKLIKKVVSKNTKMFAKFKEAHPDCLTYHSKYSEQYNKIVYESMGGKGDDDDMKNEKIIKNVLKEVVVNKGSESDT